MTHPKHPGKHSRVLVVDDDISIRRLMRKTLGRADFEVIEAENGLEALKLAEQYPPDIVLLDVEMPLLDGFSVCQELRGRSVTENTPVLMVTSLGDIASVNRAYEVGATDFITKPVNWPTLTHRVRYILRASNAIEKLAETVHELDESRASLAKAQRMAHLGNWELNIDTTTMSWSEELYRILGFSPGAVQPSLQSFYTGVDSADRERVKNWFMHARERGKVSDITYDVVTRAGKRRTVHQRAEAIVDSSGTLQELHAAVQDITEQKQAEEEIRRLAYFDTVTGLPNRAAFEERLSQAVALAKRNDRQLAVLFLDLDNFKRINDTLGHTIGDLLLKEIAGRLLTAIRRSDTVTRNQPDEDDKNLARLGGDEFIVLLSEIRRSEDAAIVANRILETLSQPVNVAGHEISVTPSIGIAVFPKDGDDVESLLKNADVAMYAAKRRRKNQYQFFAEKMNATALWRLKLEERLRKALERQELELHYQPLVDLSTEKILGVEALLRWNHSKLGQVPPAEFIPVAEETGLIAKIGEWVLRSACSQAKAWRNSGLPIARMSVNISVVQFVQSNFVDLVVKILKQTGLEADALELEVTESLLMKNAEEAVNTLTALKKLGIGLAIDDFGMGYSSLAHLKRLPIDRVKIDPTFICGLDSSPKDAAIVRAILAMALTLDLGVIAEGVETVEHLRFLKAHGCNEAQGHYFGRPLPHADVAGLLRQAEYKENDTARVLQA